MRSFGPSETLPAPFLYSAFKNFLRQIAFRRVGDQRDYALPCPKPLGNFDCRVRIRSRARSTQYAFPRSQFFHHAESLIVGDHHDLVANRAVEVSGNEAVSDAFHFVRAGFSSAEDRALGLDGNSVHSWQALFQEASDTGKGSRGTAADCDGVNASLHLLKDFARGSFIVVVGVSGVVELRGQERPGVGSQQVLGTLDGALHAL